MFVCWCCCLLLFLFWFLFKIWLLWMVRWFFFFVLNWWLSRWLCKVSLIVCNCVVLLRKSWLIVKFWCRKLISKVCLIVLMLRISWNWFVSLLLFVFWLLIIWRRIWFLMLILRLNMISLRFRLVIRNIMFVIFWLIRRKMLKLLLLSWRLVLSLKIWLSNLRILVW